MQKNIHIEPSYSLTPNKLVLYNRFYRHDNGRNDKYHNSLDVCLKNLDRKFHGFTISDNANRNLKSKINWLYYLSKSRKIETYNKKIIFNFKIGFLTLTLPTVQQHPTSFITKNIFNQFLTEIRQRVKMQNYVWRLEFQKNGNVHYHIVTDSYIDYYLALNIWNRCLSKYGYVQAYRDAHSKLSFKEYYDKNSVNSYANFDDLKRRYIKGKKNNWSNPNSVDVRSVVSGRNIAGYIAKYFGKDTKTGKTHNHLDNEDNSKNLRLWFCSRSLSKLSKISGSEQSAPFNIFSIVQKCKDLFKFKAEYCTIFYFDLKTIVNNGGKMIRDLLFNYASKVGYFDFKPIV